MKYRKIIITFALFIAATLAAQSDTTQARDFFDVSSLAPAIISFSTESVAQELAQTRKVVYFFAAEWCELCRADLDQLKAQTKDFPPDTTVILVDFDNADELRMKYAIPLQDVFLQIDARGKKLKLWVGGGLNALKKHIK